MSGKDGKLRKGKGGLGLGLGLALLLATGCQTGFPRWPNWWSAKASPPAPELASSLASPVQLATPEEKLTQQQRADVQMVMAQALEKQGELEKAADAYRKVAQNDPARGDAQHRLAVVHDKLGRHDQAAQHYQEALRKNPRNADLHCDLGYCLYLQRRWSEAEQALRQAVAIRPDLSRAHNNLGLVLARTDRFDEALREFSLAGCRECEARVNLAHSLLLGRRWEAAHQQCLIAMNAPDATEPLRQRASELLALGARSSPAPELAPVAHHAELPR